MQPLFIATKPFGPWNKDKWKSYIEWSGLTQLEQLISLDTMLCHLILDEVKDDYWPHILNEDYLLCYFSNLEFMLAQLPENTDANILCVFRNPPSHPTPPKNDLDFSFVGYDLVETQTGVSALTNCGGFPKAFSNDAINKFGLLDTHGKAVKVQAALMRIILMSHSQIASSGRCLLQLTHSKGASELPLQNLLTRPNSRAQRDDHAETVQKLVL